GAGAGNHQRRSPHHPRPPQVRDRGGLVHAPTLRTAPAQPLLRRRIRHGAVPLRRGAGGDGNHRHPGSLTRPPAGTRVGDPGPRAHQIDHPRRERSSPCAWKGPVLESVRESRRIADHSTPRRCAGWPTIVSKEPAQAKWYRSTASVSSVAPSSVTVVSVASPSASSSEGPA